MTNDEKYELYDKANALQWDLYSQDLKNEHDLEHTLDSMLEILKEVIEEIEVDE